MTYEYGKSKPALRPGVRVETDEWGRVTRVSVPPKADAMSSPVQCRCGHVYDLGTVTVTQRYADCSVWTTPCCKVQVDDRHPWPGVPAAFVRLDQHGRRP